MPRLIMWNMVSLDGYFEGPNSDLSFMQHAWGPGLEAFVNDQAKGFGTIVFGRRTYEGMAAFWAEKTDLIGVLMNETPKVVFSRSLAKSDWRNSRIALGDLRSEISRIKRDSTKDAFVLGSGELCADLAKERLIDEYRFGVVSTLLGKGTHLFSRLSQNVPLEFLESRELGDKVVLLRCRPA